MNEGNVIAIREQDAYDEAREARAMYLENEFMDAAALGDLNVQADWAPLTSDWDGNRAVKRISTVGEAIAGTLDFRDGPTTEDVLDLLIRTAFGKSCEFEAYQMVERMARQFVKHNI